MHLFFSQRIENNTLLLEGEEFAHCIKALRYKIDDSIEVTDGKGTLYKARINHIAKQHLTAIIEHQQLAAPFPHKLHIAVAPTKNIDRMEWMVEKLVEIGINTISFIETEHSERKVLKTDRLHKIAVAACKQSLKYYLPAINPLVPFVQYISQDRQNQNLFMGYCQESETHHINKQAFTYNQTTLLIGPEGDFSPAEVQQAQKAGYQPITLGKSRLRTETAAIVAAALINNTEAQ